MSRERSHDGDAYDMAGATSSGPSGAAALDAAAAFVRRYVRFPTEHAFIAVTLWIAHTHAVERFYVTPRLILDSAEPGSGKTRVLELLQLVCRSPRLTISTTTAALYRRISAAEVPFTVLMDEIDAVFGAKSTPQAEDLRALLNAGYKRGATVDRCVGEGNSLKVREFKVFAPVALAGLAGRMPATLTTRSVVIHMRKRAPGEHVDAFRERDAAQEAEPIRTAVREWADSIAEHLELARPVMPDGVTDRPSEVWEALLAVADAAGGGWPALARAACRHFVLDDIGGADQSFGVRMLGHVRDVFDAASTDRMSSAALVDALVKLDESPYADLWGKPLDTAKLAKELGRYDVRPVQFKDSGVKLRGYVTWPTDSPKQDGLADPWTRYLHFGGTPGTGGTSQVSEVPGGTGVPGTPVPRYPVPPADLRGTGVPGVPPKSTEPMWPTVDDISQESS
ncbi:MAG: DUF3631 domain-containing protein [Pseudonocardia sp.]|nr:DUF3631 domain-containing protein [Pseudonocardia sp.]